MEAETFWANVNRLIKEQKTTQEDLASTIGTPFGTFRGWNFYNRLPDAVSAYRIALALNTSVEYLVSGQEPDISRKYRDALEKIRNIVNKSL